MYPDCHTSWQHTSLDPDDTSADLPSEVTATLDLNDPDRSHSAHSRWRTLIAHGDREHTRSETSWRHSGWQPTRVRVRKAMQAAGIPGNRLDRYDDCGTVTWVAQTVEDRPTYVTVGNYCKDRWCVPCSNARSRVIAHALWDRMRTLQHRFVTLTIKTDDKPLKQHLRKLYSSFKRLKQSKVWQATVDGGVCNLEVKWQSATQRWHPHLHCIVHGRYIPVQALRAAWLKATGDSYIVDVRLIKDPRKAAQYVAKYACKAINPGQIHNHDRLVEAIDALHGVRTIKTLGDWYRVPLRPKNPPTPMIIVARLDTLLSRAKEQNPDALAILWRLVNGSDPHDRYAPPLPTPRSPPTQGPAGPERAPTLNPPRLQTNDPTLWARS